MRKKIASFFLVVTMGCSVFSMQADAATQVYVQRAVNVRSEASNSAKILGVVTKGTKLSKLSEARGWTKVSYKGKEAYIASSFLTELKDGNTVDVTQTTEAGSASATTAAPAQGSQTTTKTKVYVNNSFVNIRESASSKSTLLGTAKKGAAFYRVESKNGWTKVEYGAGYAYISSQYLTTKKPANTTTQKPNSTTTKVYVNYKRVNVRKAASSKSTLLGYATQGQSFTSYGTSGIYTKVKFNGGYAYIATQYLTTKKTTSTTATTATTAPSKTVVYVNNSYINVRASASSQSKLLGKVYKGEKLYKLGTVGAFTKIEYKNSVAYVLTSYLSNKAVTATTAKPNGTKTSIAYVNNSYVNVRKSASTSSKLLGKLYKGAKVTVVGTNGSFSKIKYNNSYAYIATKYLSA